jgi:hypothetical protein
LDTTAIRRPLHVFLEIVLTDPSSEEPMLKIPPMDNRFTKIVDIPRKPIGAALPPASSAERRDTGTRRALMHRIWDEFDEMPGTSLTLPQASRLFGVPIEVCDRILISLVKDGRLRRTQDGRFRLYSFVA